MFKASQFTPTQHTTATEKARFANHFVRFCEADFPEQLFHRWFYSQLSNCFGHIAHFDHAGFYRQWFGSKERQLDFLRHTSLSFVLGQPDYGFSDVEKALIEWFSKSALLKRKEEQIASEFKKEAASQILTWFRYFPDMASFLADAVVRDYKQKHEEGPEPLVRAAEALVGQLEKQQ
jgi:hypothetical protein